MNYNLNIDKGQENERLPIWVSLRKLITIISGERRNLIMAFAAIILNAGLNLAGSYLLGYTVDNYVQNKDYHGVLIFAGIMLIMYLSAFLVNYAQMRMMGGIGQRMLFNLRGSVFEKLQELPLDFFNQNKSGDLISRINNDTDKVNQFFSQSLMQFIGSLVTMDRCGGFVAVVEPETWTGHSITGTVTVAVYQDSLPLDQKKERSQLKESGKPFRGDTGKSGQL